MKRILFVDDEPRVLEGLERLLFSYSDDWDMAFVDGGQAALDRLESEPFDVLVTDMRMPGIDGAALLRRVHVSHPRMVRIVLTGHTELEAALRAMPIAHQFLCKPCDAKLLMTVLERACSLHALIDDEKVRGLVGGIVGLPTRPRTYSALTAALADERTSMEDLATIAEHDVAVSSKLLHLVNSAFFSPKQRIGTVRAAISLLGTTMLRHLVLSIEVFQQPMVSLPGFSMDALNHHAVLVGSVAKRLMPGRTADDAFLAGMLHDVGKLILATHLPDYFGGVLREARSSGRSVAEVELEQSKVTHAEIGAYLLGLWGMPYPTVEAVAHHHAPERNRGRGLDAATAVQIADLLVGETVRGTADPSLNDGLLSMLGVTSDLPRWRAMAAELADR